MKTKIEIPSKLTDFLNSKGLLNQFIYNCEHFDREGNNDRTRNILNSFHWESTPEGYDFWSSLHIEYCSI